MPPTHAEPTFRSDNELDNKAATRDSPGEAPDPGAKADAGEVKAMAVSVIAIAQDEEGATNGEADGDTKDEDEQETDDEEGEDDGEPDTNSKEGGDNDDNDNDDEQEPSYSATAKDAAKKARKRAWYLRNRERLKLQDAVARANEYKEVQQLCTALAVKLNKSFNPTDDQEGHLLSQYRHKRGGEGRKVEDYDTWMTWLRCPICGTRKPSERSLVMHQRKEYVGEKNSQKRKDVRAEAGIGVDDEAAEPWKDEEAEQEQDEEAEQEKDEEAELWKDDEAELWKDDEAELWKDDEAELWKDDEAELWRDDEAELWKDDEAELWKDEETEQAKEQ